MRRMLLALASLVVVPAAIYACSSDDSSTPPATTADSSTGTPEASTVDSAKADTSVVDSSTALPVRCTQADFDKVAGPGGGDFTPFPGADITFPTTVAPQQYTNHCVKVKVGSTVTFAGAFSLHPLEPQGGDTPTPIPSQNTETDGGAIGVTFTAKGTFGFQCNFHPDTMFGAVQVVP
jgi:plastocyanin